VANETVISEDAINNDSVVQEINDQLKNLGITNKLPSYYPRSFNPICYRLLLFSCL
jgi:hypothetical protein